MKRITGKLKKSEFSRNVLTVFSANMIAQFLPLITAPILTRIYSPDDYGILGVVMSILAIITTVSTLGYLNCIVAAKDDLEANALAALCLKVLTGTIVVVIMGISIFHAVIVDVYKIYSAKNVLYLLPVSLFITGITSIYYNLATRYKYFGIISKNRVMTVISSSAISIAIGLWLKNYWGLVIGFFAGQLVNCVLVYIKLNNKPQILSITQLLSFSTKKVAKQYIDFPKYMMPADFINMLSNQIPIFAISRFQAKPEQAVGYYNMSNRMLGIPITLVSSSIGDVFRQRCAEDYNTKGTCRPIFIKTFKTLFLTAIIPFSILIAFGGDIFAFVFSEKWRAAGQYSQILGFLFFCRFVISPLTYVFFVAGKQKLDFILHLLFIPVGFGALYVGLNIFNNIYTGLWFFSIGYCLIYLVYLILSYKFCINENTKTVI